MQNTDVINSRASSRPGRRGPGGKLTREAIVSVARSLIEEEGPDALSMRRLASVVNSSPMALYHHVEGRADLLAAIFAQICAETPRPELPEDPWTLEILSSELALRRENLWYVEEFLAAAAAAGCTDSQSAGLYLTIWKLIIGNAVLRKNRESGQAGAGNASAALEIAEAEGMPRSRKAIAEWHELGEAADLRAEITAVLSALVGRGVPATA